jgi:signal peptidase I
MIFRWLTSKTVREALAVHKHYRRLYQAQCDLLPPEATEPMVTKLDELRMAVQTGSKGDIAGKVDELHEVATTWLKPYPHAGWRENVEVLLVALGVAMGIRTFVAQPFKIPTGSMQPTLFGVTSTNYLASDSDASFEIPTGWERVIQWFQGTSYIDIVAQNDGTIDQVDGPTGIKIINFWQKFRLGGQEYTIWFPPDFGDAPPGGNALAFRAGLDPDHLYKKGDHVIKLRMDAGDHLFVDRFTYNFRQPARGDIVVFETAGIPDAMREAYNIPSDEFYIKRLVGLPGEKMSIGNDRHVRVNGQRLDASTPHFKNVYGFDPAEPPRNSEWSGHLNGVVAREYGLRSVSNLPMFPDEQTVFDVPPDSCVVLGDNTCVSLDSRFWGALPEQYIIGKSFLVYWPLTRRFGWGHD